MLRKTLLLICVALAGVVSPLAQQPTQALKVHRAPQANTERAIPEWRDPQTVAVNKLKPRPYMMSFDSREEAVVGDYKASNFYLDLNGTWKFLYTDDYRTLPNGFSKANFDDGQWSDIKVPTNWEMQGHGTAIYTNHKYEFAPANPQPPTLPEVVPAGVYRRTFDIPQAWRDRDVYLHLGGVKSGTYVWVNGRKVGYTEDSKSAAEFLLNNYLVQGENQITLEVYRWSTGSFLECQDFFRVSGIERDVYIYSQPKVHIEDFDVVATLDSTYTDGLFKLKIAMTNNFVLESGDLQVWFELMDHTGDILEYSYSEEPMAAQSKDTVTFERRIKNVRKWSAEDPYLYTLTMRVRQEGSFTEYITQKIGFRTSEIRGNQYLVNGKRVYIKGVNYHETHPETGHYITEETIREDMRLMKEANINAIRLSHYPQQRRFYELADEYGFYLCNEANIESHGMYYDLRKGATLGNNPLWLKAHMERTENMYQQAKNYPSVMFWSLGNEAGNGYNFYETYLYLKGIDTLRPVQYERALLEWNTDIFCPQYPSAGTFKRWGEMTTDRPYIASEYAHAMGNSTGNFKDQWDEIYKYDNLQGGFIWDWVDQGFYKYNADSSLVTLAYGGDFGENMPSDGNFLANGVVDAERIPRPGLREIAKVYSYVKFEQTDAVAGKYQVKNIYDFSTLEKYTITATLKANGRTVSSKNWTLDLKPDETTTLTFAPSSSIKLATATDYYVHWSVKLKADDGLLKKGFEVASEQFRLPLAYNKTAFKNTTTIKEDSDAESFYFSNSRFVLNIDRKSGLIDTYGAGDNLMWDNYPLRPNFWRAPTDNDFGSRFPSTVIPWRDLSLGDIQCEGVQMEKVSASQYKVTASFALAEGCSLEVVYTIYGSGALHVGYNFKGNPSSKTQLYRQGFRMRLPQEYSTLQYFGRGEIENYVDRKYAADVDLYKTNVKLEGTDYIRPQENGHHSDTRWLTLTRGERGGGLLVLADQMVEFNALMAALEDLDSESSDAPYQWNRFSPTEDHSHSAGYMIKPKQTHATDIVERDFVELSVDGRMMGVGGDDSWHARPYAQYMINAKDDYSFGFTLVPLRSASEAAAAVKYSY